jgi:hypothetical protein
MPDKMLPDISSEEYLFRGVPHIQWDFQHNRPSSAIFKDSKGVSVDRDYKRKSDECIHRLLELRDFVSVIKIKVQRVLEINASVFYKPTPDNIYHSEIHDSPHKINIGGSKAQKLRDSSEVVYCNF